MIAFGIWLHVVPAKTAAVLVIWCSIVGQIVSMLMLRKAMDVRRSLPYVLPGLLFIPVGTWLLVQFDPSIFKITIGFFLVFFTSAMLLAGKVRFEGLRFLDPVAGAIGGVMGGFAGLFGAPVTLWCTLRGWGKDQQRSVYQPFNFVMGVAAFIGATLAGLVDLKILLLCFLTLPATIAAVTAGVKLYGRMNNEAFRILVLCFLFLSGFSLIVPALF